ncbi:MAG: DUF4129 domain-containing protein [Halobacteriales archaeon]
MDRHRTRRVVLALLAVAAVALVATAAAPLFEQEAGGDVSRIEQPSGDDRPEGADVIPEIPLDLIMLAVLVFVAIAVAAQFVADPWGALKGTLVAVTIAGGIIGFAYVVLEFFEPSPGEPEQPAAPNGTPPREVAPNGSFGSGGGTGNPLVLPGESLVVIALVVGTLGAVTVLAWRAGTIQSALGLDVDGGDAEEADLGALGQVAGDAAADVEAASTAAAADNAIYRAWSEMVALLDAPDPQSGTPRQFASAAIDAGMDPEDVSVLTRTFEEVRYGDAALSDERRERAAEALRRIEATHGDNEAASPQSGSVSERKPREFWDPGEDR